MFQIYLLFLLNVVCIIQCTKIHIPYEWLQGANFNFGEYNYTSARGQQLMVSQIALFKNHQQRMWTGINENFPRGYFKFSQSEKKN